MKTFFVVKSNFLRQDERIPADSLLALIKQTTEVSQADAILVLGGDGTMLESIRRYREAYLPFLGFNYGHVGFLMNDVTPEALFELRNNSFEFITVRLLKAKLYDAQGSLLDVEYAFNDVYMERASTATAHLALSVNQKQRYSHLTPLIADGLIVSTAGGSTAYNASAGGRILPIDVEAMSLTCISPAVFHKWQNCILSPTDTVSIEALSTQHRPVRTLVDGIEKVGVRSVVVSTSTETVTLAFVRSQEFREKVLSFQLG